jgi:hypothetical protein
MTQEAFVVRLARRINEAGTPLVAVADVPLTSPRPPPSPQTGREAVIRSTNVYNH